MVVCYSLFRTLPRDLFVYEEFRMSESSSTDFFLFKYKPTEYFCFLLGVCVFPTFLVLYRPPTVQIQAVKLTGGSNLPIGVNGCV